jgi:hypothetical protein
MTSEVFSSTARSKSSLKYDVPSVCSPPSALEETLAMGSSRSDSKWLTIAEPPPPQTTNSEYILYHWCTRDWTRYRSLLNSTFFLQIINFLEWSRGVYQTLLPVVVEVPKPSLSASVQIAFFPGAPGASPVVSASPGYGPAVVPTKTIATRTAIPTNKRSPIGKR